MGVFESVVKDLSGLPGMTLQLVREWSAELQANPKVGVGVAVTAMRELQAPRPRMKPREVVRQGEPHEYEPTAAKLAQQARMREQGLLA